LESDVAGQRLATVASVGQTRKNEICALRHNIGAMGAVW
jgi:hypothetical protein